MRKAKPACALCRDEGFVVLHGRRFWLSGGQNTPSSVLEPFRVPCDCKCGQRFYAVRRTGAPLGVAPKTWGVAVALVMEHHAFKSTEALAGAMGLPVRFVRATLDRARREREKHDEGDQAPEAG